MATLKKLMTLLSKEGLVENRAEVIHTFTRGRTSSARDLSENEIWKNKNGHCRKYRRNEN